mgnify:CR=1 FL=1|jgi:hypothetical protein
MREQRYTKDPRTGAVIFTDTDGYAARKKVLENQKITTLQEENSKKVINSLRNEVSDLKILVQGLIDG